MDDTCIQEVVGQIHKSGRNNRTVEAAVDPVWADEFVQVESDEDGSNALVVNYKLFVA